MGFGTPAGAHSPYHDVTSKPGTPGTRYNKDAAELAWRRTVEFLHAALGS